MTVFFFNLIMDKNVVVSENPSEKINEKYMNCSQFDKSSSGGIHEITILKLLRLNRRSIDAIKVILYSIRNVIMIHLTSILSSVISNISFSREYFIDFV